MQSGFFKSQLNRGRNPALTINLGIYIAVSYILSQNETDVCFLRDFRGE